MELEAKNISFEGKEKVKIPAGAVILKKEVRVSVEEIENGFIIKKSFDIKYSINKSTDYCYYTIKVFSETNPIKIEEDKMLADLFD